MANSLLDEIGGSVRPVKTNSQRFLSLVSAGIGLVALALAIPATAATTNVVVSGGLGTYGFSPPVLSIQAGDKVIWNGLGTIHSVTGTTPPETLCGSSFPGSCTNIFNTPGTYLYHCINHSSPPFGHMTGVVQVLPPVAVPAVLMNAFMSNGNFQFTVSSVAQRTNLIQATTNVASTSSWEAIATLVPTTNTFNFTDSNANLFPLRFYRVVEP